MHASCVTIKQLFIMCVVRRWACRVCRAGVAGGAELRWALSLHVITDALFGLRVIRILPALLTPRIHTSRSDTAAVARGAGHGARGDERTCYVALIVSPVATPTAAASTGTSIKHGCAATAVIITAAAPH